MRPFELSARFIAAHNERDAATMRSMLASDVLYLRPGAKRREGVDAIISAYQKEWERYAVEVVVLRGVEEGDTFAAEIEVRSVDGERTFLGSVFHQWRDDLLVYYRAYFDPT